MIDGGTQDTKPEVGSFGVEGIMVIPLEEYKSNRRNS